MFSMCLRAKYYDLDGSDVEDSRLSAYSEEFVDDLSGSRNSMAMSLGTLLAHDEGIANSKHDAGSSSSRGNSSSSSSSSSSGPSRRRMSAYNNAADIGWENSGQHEMRTSRGHLRISTRLSNLDLFKSTLPFYTWSTTQQSRHASLSEHGGFDNVVATKTNGGNHWTCTVKANMVMHEGQHYFEVELMPGSCGGVMIGVARENVDPDSCHHTWYGDRPQRAWLMFAMLGEDSRSFGAGDRVGVLVNLDAGSVSFFKNGHMITRPKQASGRVWQRLSGPVVPAVQLFDEGDAVRFVSDVSPPGCGNLCP